MQVFAAKKSRRNNSCRRISLNWLGPTVHFHIYRYMYTSIMHTLNIEQHPPTGHQLRRDLGYVYIYIYICTLHIGITLEICPFEPSGWSPPAFLAERHWCCFFVDVKAGPSKVRQYRSKERSELRAHEQPTHDVRSSARQKRSGAPHATGLKGGLE